MDWDTPSETDAGHDLRKGISSDPLAEALESTARSARTTTHIPEGARLVAYDYDESESDEEEAKDQDDARPPPSGSAPAASEMSSAPAAAEKDEGNASSRAETGSASVHAQSADGKVHEQSAGANAAAETGEAKSAQTKEHAALLAQLAKSDGDLASIDGQ